MILAVFSFVSCVETSQVCEDLVKLSIESAFEADDTKTVLVNRTNVYWQDGDEIAVMGTFAPEINIAVASSTVQLKNLTSLLR